jgi:ATP-binding cassette subfamily B protein
MSDEHDKRELPTTWRDYVRDMRATYHVYTWVWKELIGGEAQRRMKRGVLWIIVAMVFGLIEPWFVRYFLDGLGSGVQGTVVMGFVCYFSVRLVSMLCYTGFETHREYVFGESFGQMDRRMNQLFFEKSMGQHSRHRRALSTSSMEKARAKVIDSINVMLFEGLHAFTEFVLVVGFLFFVSWVVGVMFLGAVVIMLGFMVFTNQSIVKECTGIDEQWKKYNNGRTESWDKVERVKSCGSERFETMMMDEKFYVILQMDRKFWLWFIKMLIPRRLVVILVEVIAVGYGILQVWDGTWTIGLLYPVLAWSRHMSDSLGRLSGVEHRLNWNMPSIRGMRKTLTMEPEVVDAPDAIVLEDDMSVHVVFENLSHAYVVSQEIGDEEGGEVLQNVSFEILPGEKVALIGSSGAGKTTLGRLLQRYEDPSAGRILINGVDLRLIQQESWHRLIGYVPQKSMIFAGTVEDNFLFGWTKKERQTITREELWGMAVPILGKKLCARLREGLDTLLGPDGVDLSGGEAQRVMLVAALVKRPKVLIIDEGTSALDSDTEAQVQMAMEKLVLPGTSVLMIAHRLATTRKCGKFVVLSAVSELVPGQSQIETLGTSFQDTYARSAIFRKSADMQGLQ